jgi:hypothetical protein
MKTLLLAGAVLASVACQSEPAADVVRSSQESGAEDRSVPQPSTSVPDPTTTTTEAPPEPSTTTTTEAEPEPATTVAPVAVRRTTTTVEYEPPTPQSRTTGRGSEPPANDVWGGLGECESGNANVDTGNGYSGYFQFSDATWRSMGTGYARAVDAPYAVQLDAAQRLQARSGWGQWPACSRSMGLR